MSPRNFVVGAVGLGLVLRLAFGLGYWQGKPMTHDEREYLALASNMAAGRGFTTDLPGDVTSPSVERFARGPGYPAFIAVALFGDASLRSGRLPTEVPTRLKVVQALLGGVAVWLIALAAWRVAGPPAGAAAALIAAVYPPLVWICAYALTEGVYVVLAMTMVLALGRVTDGPVEGRRAWMWTGLGGVLAGAATLTRPVTLFLLPVAAAWLAGRRKLWLAALFLACALGAIGPWTLRNWHAYDRFVLVAASGGVNFWTGNHPLAVGEGDLAANPAIKQANVALRAAHAGFTPAQLEPVYYQEAFAWIRREPLAWAALMARKAFYTLVPIGPSYRLHSSLYSWGSLIPYVLTVPLAVAGVRRLRGRARQPRAVWMLAASAVLAGLVFFPQERYRIPAIDPALIVCAACWLGLRREAGPPAPPR
jgi:4-amino-4-deoxy-L-arabinose transferase-like glycosyltransferase